MVCLTWAEDCLPTYKCSNPCTFNSWFPSSLGILKGFPSCQGINTRFPSIKGIVQIIYRGPIPFRPGNQCQIPKILGNHLRVPCRLGNQYSVPVNKRNHKAISCADSLPVRESWSYSRNRRESWKNRFRFPSMTGIGGQFRDRKGTGGIQERSSFPCVNYSAPRESGGFLNIFFPVTGTGEKVSYSSNGCVCS